VAAASRCAGVPKLGEVGEQSGQKGWKRAAGEEAELGLCDAIPGRPRPARGSERPALRRIKVLAPLRA